MLPPWLENVSMMDVIKKNHHDAGTNSMLIQIVDDKGLFPETDFPFKEIHQFIFNDVEEDFDKTYGIGISDEQAKELVNLLKHALDKHMNVVVHCVAGLCRSGAVVEVGEMMGFRAIPNPRMPNTLVKQKMMKVLGWTYN